MLCETLHVALMLGALVALAAVGTAWTKPITITTHTHELNTPGMGGSFVSQFACQGDQLYRIWAPDNNVFHVTAAGVEANGDFIPPFVIHFSRIGETV